MQFERVLVGDVAVGDLIRLDDEWWTVNDARPESEHVTVSLSQVRTGRVDQRRLATTDRVDRGDATAVHHQDEFLGMTRDEAQAWANALGWVIVDMAADVGTLTFGPGRGGCIFVWFGADSGRVERTRIG